MNQIKIYFVTLFLLVFTKCNGQANQVYQKSTTSIEEMQKRSFVASSFQYKANKENINGGLRIDGTYPGYNGVIFFGFGI